MLSSTKRQNICRKLWIFVFATKMGKKIGKNISKSLDSKYSQKRLDHAKQSATDAFKTSSKRVIQKRVEATGDLIGNRFADKITRASKTSPKNNLETDKEEMLREKYISPKLRQKFIDELRLNEENF